jgi:pyrroline-5-carboxylate reductase
MRVGLIGSGNMARALARGWGEPVLCTDSGSGRARALVDELGGEVAESNAELARAADLVVLCHKPAQLDAVAAEAQEARAIASVLGATPLAELQRAYPDRPVFRFMPNTPVEVRAGIVCYSPAEGVDGALERSVLELFGRLGRVVTLDERLLEVATGVSGVGPAYLALATVAWADAAVRRGLPAGPAVELAIGTLAGTAALLEARGGDTLGVRREVTSPGGSTARGLAALERVGLRRAFQEALDAVLDGSR